MRHGQAGSLTGELVWHWTRTWPVGPECFRPVPRSREEPMDKTLRQLLDHLLASGRDHDAQEAVHAHRLLNLEPETAQLIAIMVRSGRRMRVLEIGTSNGYSAIWLAWAL